jgi:adenylate cyclase
VIIEDDDIYGDGVNIAARLEPVAAPGGICISSIVNESIGNRIDVRSGAV